MNFAIRYNVALMEMLRTTSLEYVIVSTKEVARYIKVNLEENYWFLGVENPEGYFVQITVKQFLRIFELWQTGLPVATAYELIIGENNA